MHFTPCQSHWIPASCVAAVTTEVRGLRHDEATCTSTEGCTYTLSRWILVLQPIRMHTPSRFQRPGLQELLVGAPTLSRFKRSAVAKTGTELKPSFQAGRACHRDYVGCFLDRSAVLCSRASRRCNAAKRTVNWVRSDVGRGGDYATLNHVEDFTGDGTFSIAFVHEDSATPNGPYQVLYSHMGANYSWGTRADDHGRLLSSVQSTASGDVTGVMFNDDDGQRGTSTRRAGCIRQWLRDHNVGALPQHGHRRRTCVHRRADVMRTSVFRRTTVGFAGLRQLKTSPGQTLDCSESSKVATCRARHTCGPSPWKHSHCAFDTGNGPMLSS